MNKQHTQRHRFKQRQQTQNRVTPNQRVTHDELPTRRRAFTERQVSRLLPLVFALLAIGGGIVGVHYGWHALCSSSRVQIGQLEISKLRHVSRSEVDAYTRIGIGDSLLALDLDNTALNLRQHPWIQSVRMERHLPNRLVIDINEHQTSLIVSLGELYLVNQHGQLFKLLQKEDKVILPVLTGLSRQSVTENPQKTQKLIRYAIELAKVIHEDYAKLGTLEEIHWDAGLGWQILCYPPSPNHYPLLVNLGFSAQSRIRLVTKALFALQTRGFVVSILWVNGEKNPNRVHARLAQKSSDLSKKTLIAKVR